MNKEERSGHEKKNMFTYILHKCENNFIKYIFRPMTFFIMPITFFHNTQLCVMLVTII